MAVVPCNFRLINQRNISVKVRVRNIGNTRATCLYVKNGWVVGLFRQKVTIRCKAGWV